MIGIIKPSTVLVISLNVLIFMLMQILLFWYLISKAIENIIIDKSTVVREIIYNSTILRTKLNDYVQSNEYQLIYNQSIIDKATRTEYNMKLTWQWMLIPFILITTVLVLGIIYTIYVHQYTRYNTLKLDRADIIILVTEIFSFITEIIFIFVLVVRYVYISDSDIIIFFFNSKFGKELVTTITTTLPTLPTLSPFTLPPVTPPPFTP